MLLKKVVSFVGCLFGGAVGSGCTRGNDLADRTFKADFPVTREQTRALIKRPSMDSLGEAWAMVRFADPLHFKRLDEAVEAFGHEAVTLADLGEAHTGRYAMRATLRKGYTGGPPGSATELFVELDDVRLVEALSPPKAPPGKKGILPGQVVVRMIPEGELARLDDRYLVELPANRKVTVWFEPWPNDYGFKLSVAKDGATLPMGARDFDNVFETTSASIYELRVLPADRAAKQPDSYFFYITWGNAFDTSGPLADRKIKFTDTAVKATGAGEHR
jgi:hypothetical protein